MTPTQQAAYEAATLKRTGKAPADDLRMFAAGLAHGIAQERARWMPLVREMRGNLSCESMNHSRKMFHSMTEQCLALKALDEKIEALACAAAIESPTPETAQQRSNK